MHLPPVLSDLIHLDPQPRIPTPESRAANRGARRVPGGRLPIAVTLAVTVLACTRAAPHALVPAPSAGTTVTILHFNDVYEITPLEGGRAGGLSRVATLRKRLLAERGQVLTTLGGDFLSPSALGTARIDGEPLAGRQMVGVLNAAGLDWATLGNHELDVSEAQFRARVAESRFRYVISNVTDSAGRRLAGIPPYAIVPVSAGGRTVRLALIGILLPANRAPWVRYATDPTADARRWARILRDSSDAVIALTHQYYFEDARLAEEVPEIDLVLGGHEHDNFLLRRGAHHTPIVKADGNVRSVQVVTLRFPPGGGRPAIGAELVPITDALPDDPETAAEVARWIDAAFAGYARDGFDPRAVVANLPEPLDARELVIRSRGNAMTDLLLGAMQRESPRADAWVFNAGSVRIDDIVPAGPVTQYDVIRMLPFGGPLVEVRMTGGVLARMVRAGPLNRETGGFLHSRGAEAVGSEVRVGGAPIDPARTYTVVTTDYLLTGRERNLDFVNLSNPEVSIARRLRDVRMSLIEELGARWPATGRPDAPPEVDLAHRRRALDRVRGGF